MSDAPRSEHDHLTEARTRLLEAALIHVVFDGWSDATLRAATQDSGVEPGLAKLAFPRGGVDMALAFHRQGDARLRAELTPEALSGLGMTAKITHAIRRRLELVAMDKEAVRRGTALLALPMHSVEGGKAIWDTADTIWSALGDTSTDYNWYTKRATLAAVYSATVLYWLGDESEGSADTWAFLDRRIGDVMQIEKMKGKMRESGLGRAFAQGPGRLFERIKAPGAAPSRPLPGRIG